MDFHNKIKIFYDGVNIDVFGSLEYIEGYLDRLTSAWGHEIDARPEVAEADNEEAALLNGPALEGEGVDQDYVDDMFSEVSSDRGTEDTPPDKSDVKASEKEKAKPDLESGSNIDQDDIDALFN